MIVAASGYSPPSLLVFEEVLVWGLAFRPTSISVDGVRLGDNDYSFDSYTKVHPSYKLYIHNKGHLLLLILLALFTGTKKNLSIYLYHRNII